MKDTRTAKEIRSNMESLSDMVDQLQNEYEEDCCELERRGLKTYLWKLPRSRKTKKLLAHHLTNKI